MGQVFAANSREAVEDENAESYGDVPWLGEYIFMYDDICRLREKTGELIDAQKDAFFGGANLASLEKFAQAGLVRALAQPEAWEQRVGKKLPGGEPVFCAAHRAVLVSFLDGVVRAVAAARANKTGVFFYGE